MGFVRDLTGKTQADAAKEGAARQEDFARQALEKQEQAYQEILPGLGQFLSPQYRDAFMGGEGSGEGAGMSPLDQLRAASGALGPEAQAEFYKGFQEDPGTQFLREQGQKGINQQLAAQGGLGGGARLKALSDFNQGLANQQLQQRLSQLGGLAQTDIGLGTGLANLRTGLGSAQAQNLQNIGGIQAQGLLGAAQARNQGASGLLGNIVSGIGAAAGFSDRRLKENISKVGEYKGVPWYTWDWTEEAQEIVGDQPGEGVIADEIDQTFVYTDPKTGYAMVDYDQLWESWKK